MDEIVYLLEHCFIEIGQLLKDNNSHQLGKLVNNQNNSGDDVKKVDILSNELIKAKFLNCNLIRNIGSEEDAELTPTPFTKAPYLLCYDPLDGSSNVDINITTGTIFALYQYNGR